MRVDDQTIGKTPDFDRGYVLSMVVANFRGRQNVEIHLFRPEWNAAEESAYTWDKLLGEPLHKDQPIDPEGSRKVFLETLSRKEKDVLLTYLQDRYADRLVSVQASLLPLPIPIGLTPLSAVAEDERFGCIHLNKVPNYPLDFPIHGLYQREQKGQDEGQAEADGL